MGVYIKNMEMPKSCYVCPFMFHERRLPYVWCTVVNGNWLDLRETICDERHPNCPIVPVPPHGRLIDARKLHEKGYQHYEDYTNGKSDGKKAILNIEKEIMGAPTIIEAEED